MSRRYVRHPDLRLTALEGEGVALHLGTRRYFTVSETGLAILEALKTPRTLEELTALIEAAYDVTHDHATASVSAFVTRCVDSALIHDADR